MNTMFQLGIAEVVCMHGITMGAYTHVEKQYKPCAICDGWAQSEVETAPPPRTNVHHVFDDSESQDPVAFLGVAEHTMNMSQLDRLISENCYAGDMISRHEPTSPVERHPLDPFVKFFGMDVQKAVDFSAMADMYELNGDARWQMARHIKAHPEDLLPWVNVASILPQMSDGGMDTEVYSEEYTEEHEVDDIDFESTPVQDDEEVDHTPATRSRTIGHLLPQVKWNDPVGGVREQVLVTDPIKVGLKGQGRWYSREDWFTFHLNVKDEAQWIMKADMVELKRIGKILHESGPKTHTPQELSVLWSYYHLMAGFPDGRPGKLEAKVAPRLEALSLWMATSRKPTGFKGKRLHEKGAEYKAMFSNRQMSQIWQQYRYMKYVARSVKSLYGTTRTPWDDVPLPTEESPF